MTLEHAEKIWSEQPAPGANIEEIQATISKHLRKTKQQPIFFLIFAILSCVAGTVIFYGSYFQQDEGLLLALLRSVPPWVILPINIIAYRKLKQKLRQQENSQYNQQKCLTLLVEDLKEEADGPKKWIPLTAAFSVVGLVGLVKWLDYQRGGDTAAEGISIVVAVIAISAVVFAFAHHHRKEIAMPRYQYFKNLLDGMRNETV